MPMKRVRMLAYWTIPSLLCLALYWPALRAWFQQDDFAWLGLGHSIEGPGGVIQALFAPMAQGTIRPLSERAFFLVFEALFGLRGTPYHAWVFLTQFANLVLLGAIACRVTGSRLAGFMAPVFWVANSALIVPLSWASAYNQILGAFFVLLAFHFLLRYIETGERRFLAAQWAAFIVGFGALETIVVYPVIAAAYTWFFARKYFLKTLPLFAASAAYAALHYFVAPYESTDPAYVLHFEPSMAQTFWTYWQSALGPANLRQYFSALPGWVEPAGTAALTAGIAGFTALRARRHDWRPAFGFVWFLALIAPVLPLRDHVTPYYLTIAAAGLALAASYALAQTLRSPAWKYVASGLAAVYLICGAVQGRLGSEAVAERSWRARIVALGAQRARSLHPGKAIILAGVDSQLFWTAVVYNPFRLLGISDVYLEPDSETRIESHPALGSVTSFVMPAGTLRKALEAGDAVVYRVEPRRLRAATFSYRMKARESWKTEEPWRVDVGEPAFAGQLGPEWYELEHGRRWMPKLATIRIRGHQSADERLYVSGWCPPVQVEKGPLRLYLALDGKSLPEAAVLRAPGPFQFALRLPPPSASAATEELAIHVERTFRVPGDGRELGLVFGSFEIRK